MSLPKFRGRGTRVQHRCFCQYIRLRHYRCMLLLHLYGGGDFSVCECPTIVLRVFEHWFRLCYHFFTSPPSAITVVSVFLRCCVVSGQDGCVCCPGSYSQNAAVSRVSSHHLLLFCCSHVGSLVEVSHAPVHSGSGVGGGVLGGGVLGGGVLGGGHPFAQ